MSITLYTAPDCLRCKIVKSWLADKSMAYDTIDFKADSTAFNAFYRAKRADIYRNPEGVEFPLFDDGKVVKQGSGEIIAYLLAGHDLECCVTRSDLLHGWISGLYPSRCPAHLAEHFVQLVCHLGQGGLQLCLRVDGTHPTLLEKLLALNLACKVEVESPASGFYAGGQQPSVEDTARTLALAQNAPDHALRLLLAPVEGAEGWQWPNREAVMQAAKHLAQAANNKQVACQLAVTGAPLPQGMEALTPADMLKYRSAAREYLFKIENAPVA